MELEELEEPEELEVHEDLEEYEELEEPEVVDQFKDHHARLYRKRGTIKHPSVAKFFGHRQICYM